MGWCTNGPANERTKQMAFAGVVVYVSAHLLPSQDMSSPAQGSSPELLSLDREISVLQTFLFSKHFASMTSFKEVLFSFKLSSHISIGISLGLFSFIFNFITTLPVPYLYKSDSLMERGGLDMFTIWRMQYFGGRNQMVASEGAHWVTKGVIPLVQLGPKKTSSNRDSYWATTFPSLHKRPTRQPIHKSTALCRWLHFIHTYQNTKWLFLTTERST